MQGYDQFDDVHFADYMYVTDTPCAVELTGDIPNFVYDHFRAEGQDKTFIEILAPCHNVWYGKIDGRYSMQQ